MPITLNGRVSECSLYIGAEVSASAAFVASASKMLDNLDTLDLTARTRFLNDLQHDEERIVDFIDYHLEECAEDVNAKTGDAPTTKTAFLNHIKLVGIGIHVVDGQLQFGCDYSIGRDFTDQLLVAKFDASSVLHTIAWES